MSPHTVLEIIIFFHVILGGDVCKCHDDDVKGHWTGDACDECVSGWDFPSCTVCTPGMYIESNITLDRIGYYPRFDKNVGC